MTKKTTLTKERLSEQLISLFKNAKIGTNGNVPADQIDKMQEICSKSLILESGEYDDFLDEVMLGVGQVPNSRLVVDFFPTMQAIAETTVISQKGFRDRQGTLFAIGFSYSEIQGPVPLILEQDVKEDIQFILKEKGVVSEETECLIIPELFSIAHLAALNESDVAYLIDSLGSQIEQGDEVLEFPAELRLEEDPNSEATASIKILIGVAYCYPENSDDMFTSVRELENDSEEGDSEADSSVKSWAELLTECMEDHFAGSAYVTGLNAPSGFFIDIRDCKDMARSNEFKNHVLTLTEQYNEDDKRVTINVTPYNEEGLVSGYLIKLAFDLEYDEDCIWPMYAHEDGQECFYQLRRALMELEDVVELAPDLKEPLQYGTVSTLH